MKRSTPKHVAIVMDGNGRWAKAQGKERIEGHRAGLSSVKEIIQCCLKEEIGCLSLFAFSSENWSRPSEEVDFLMQLFFDALQMEIQALNEQGIQILFTGEKSALSLALQERMAAAEALTANNSKLKLNVVVNYGGKWDIVTAAKKAALAIGAGQLQLEALDETSFASFLSTATLPDPDLFIRTSGELRISNFFLWQTAYTELYFTTTYWPDFKAEAFEKALLAYSQRQRRYGQLLSTT